MRNTGNRKRNIRSVSGAHYGFLRLFGLSSLTLSISERCEKWVKQCIKRSRQLGIYTCRRLNFHERIGNTWRR